MSEGIRNEGVLPVERKVSAIRAIDSQTNDALEKLMKEIERTSLFTKVEADEIIEAIKEIQSLSLGL
jgi:tellurite resistance protein